MTLHRVVSREDYLAELEEHILSSGQQVLFFHVRFASFTKAALKQALADWRLFRQCVTAPIYAVAGEDDGPKWHAFVSLFGFTPTGTHISLNNGERRQLYLSKVNEHVLDPSPTRPATEQPVGAGNPEPEHRVDGRERSPNSVPGSGEQPAD